MLKNSVNNICNTLKNRQAHKNILSDFMHQTAIEEPELAIDFLNSCGLSIVNENDLVSLKTSNTLVKDQIFCFVDIETNGPKATDHQIIEIAAVLTKNSQIIQTYQTLVTCEEISDSIEEITGLNKKILTDGILESVALTQFKALLKNAVFVAHNVGFDFSFIAKRMERLGIGMIFNRRLCTVELAKRTLDAPKYGLKSLSETFNLPKLGSHRALPDALASKDIFELSLRALNNDDMSVEELIKFSENAPLFRREND